jgi:hypothetical protein
MRRLFIVIAALMVTAAATVAAPARPADASWGWCWDDPTLVIGGQAVHIDLGVPADQRSLIKGSTLTVVVPSNVTAYLAGTNAAYFPITVTIVRSGTWNGVGSIPVTAKGVVNGPSTVATGIKAWQAGATWSKVAYGTGGSPMSLAFGVAPSSGFLTSLR